MNDLYFSNDILLGVIGLSLAVGVGIGIICMEVMK